MASQINTEEKRRAAFNYAMWPYLTFPVPKGSIEDEDRAMTHNSYLEGAFPPPPHIIIAGGGMWYRHFSTRI